jgi:hypothetical protein
MFKEIEAGNRGSGKADTTWCLEPIAALGIKHIWIDPMNGDGPCYWCRNQPLNKPRIGECPSFVLLLVLVLGRIFSWLAFPGHFELLRIFSGIPYLPF